MNVCNNLKCTKEANQRCSGCKSVYYCSKECQKIDWKVHKTSCITKVSSPTTTNVVVANVTPQPTLDRKGSIDFMDMAKFIGEMLFSGAGASYALIDYRGSRCVTDRNGVRSNVYFFSAPTKENIKGSFYKWFTDPARKIPMKGQEFANWFTTGICSTWAFGVAIALDDIINTKTITIGASKVKEVRVLAMKITKEFTRNVSCYTDPMPPEDKSDIENWDCDMVHSDIHQVVGIILEDSSLYIADFSAAQYGIYDRFHDTPVWFHFEKSDIKIYDKSARGSEILSYGKLFEVNWMHGDGLEKLPDKSSIRTGFIFRLSKLISKECKSKWTNS